MATSQLQTFIAGSQQLINELKKRGHPLPDEILRIQDLLVCLDANAEKIASALVASRRRKSSEGLVGASPFFREQDKLLQQAVALFKQLAAREDLDGVLQTISSATTQAP